MAPLLGQASDGISNLDPTPLYPFGHGLSYTTFDYEELRAVADRWPTDDEVVITVRVANTGAVAGDDVVQLYLTDEIAQVTRPVRTLIGYARIHLEPGRSAEVDFLLHADRTSFTGVDYQRVVEPGWVVLSCGPSVADLPLSARLELVGPLREVAQPALVTPTRVRAKPDA